MYNTIIDQSLQCIEHIDLLKKLCNDNEQLFINRNKKITELTNTIRQLSIAKGKLLTDIEKEKNKLLTTITNARKDFELYSQKLINDSNNKIKHFENEVKIDEMVTLNVGGKLFTTRKCTLQSIENTFLYTLVSGRFKPPYDRNGNIFIDRDGQQFAHILNYLRDTTYLNTINSKYSSEKDMISIEANYYGIIPLVLNKHIGNYNVLENDSHPTIREPKPRSKIKVYWTGDMMWYNGIVVDTFICSVSKLPKMTVKYDDGDIKLYYINKTKWIYDDK